MIYTNGSLTRLWKHRASELKYARNLFLNLKNQNNDYYISKVRSYGLHI